eukprot:scaffold7243_cov394-Prasinococcus_capsulatus_cf.AAC.21
MKRLHTALARAPPRQSASQRRAGRRGHSLGSHSGVWNPSPETQLLKPSTSRQRKLLKRLATQLKGSTDWSSHTSAACPDGFPSPKKRNSKGTNAPSPELSPFVGTPMQSPRKKSLPTSNQKTPSSARRQLFGPAETDPSGGLVSKVQPGQTLDIEVVIEVGTETVETAPQDGVDAIDDLQCEICGGKEDEASLLICDGCEKGRRSVVHRMYGPQSRNVY